MTELKKTSLTDRHVELKAKMAPFGGFNMPLQYSSVKGEVQAVRQSAGIFDAGHMGEFLVEGAHAIDFVDYLLTNDFKNAQMEKAVYSPMCMENGAVIDDLIAYKLAEQKVLLCVNASNIEKDWQWVCEHKKDFDCTLTNISNELGLIALQGPASEAILWELKLIPKGEFPYYSAKEIALPDLAANFKLKNDCSIVLARTGYTGEDGFEIFVPADWAKILWDQLMDLGAIPCGLAARDVLRLEVGYPLYGQELNDQLTPFDAGLSWTVKREKERFLGKNSLEKNNSQFRSVKLMLDKGIPRPGHPIENELGQLIGEVTSGTFSVTLQKGIALARIKKNQFPENKNFIINIRGKKYPAIFCERPFVSGGHK